MDFNLSEEISRQFNEIEDTAYSLSEEVRNERQATINSEQHLQELKETVTSLQKELSTERTERAKADKENTEYTKAIDEYNKRENRKNSIVAIAGLIVGIVSLFATFFK